MALRGLATLGLWALVGCGRPAPGPRFVVHAPGDAHPTGRVELCDVAAPSADLRLRVADAPPGAPDVLGTASVAGAVVAFTPRFALQPELAYRVSYGGAPPLALEFSLAARPAEPRVEVLAVYPDGAELPANVLKFYVHFSEPVRRGEAYRRARLLDDSGVQVQGAFLEIEPELWNAKRTRLTLLVDPGRIKRGLVPHEELGPVLLPGREYVLEVDAAWRDDRGAPLLRGLRHVFRTRTNDARSPEPRRWQVTAPRAGTREALAVRFDEVLDHALVERLLDVEAASGVRVAGTGSVDEDQAGWRFVPESAWEPAPHELVVPALLEDLAGNSVGRPFELDDSSLQASELEEPASRVAFTPR